MTTPTFRFTRDQPERSRSPEGCSSGDEFTAMEESPWRKGASADDLKPEIGKQVAEELGENSALSKEISNILKDVIMNHRKGLQNIYGRTDLDGTLRMQIKKGVEMVRSLTSEMACDRETAKDLTVLTLYNVAILIGMFCVSVCSLGFFFLFLD